VSRRLKVSAAQLGPIHRADNRKSVVNRLMEMLKEAHSRGRSQGIGDCLSVSVQQCGDVQAR